MKRFFTILSLVLVLGTHSGRAQITNMSLIGSVQSDERQPLPGAAITVIHLPSGVRHAAASDGAGRFVIPNLMVGGPYLMQIGEGGYRPQTVSSILLETGKTATFPVIISKLAANPTKDRAGRAAEKSTSTEALAQESVVSGPVLISTATKSPSSRSRVRAAAPAAPMPLATRAAPPVASAPAPVASIAPAASVAPTSASAAPAARYYRNSARRSSTKVDDFIVPGRYDTKTDNYIYGTDLPTTLKLTDGGAIADIGLYSTESFLYRFLINPQMQVDTVDLTKGWYNFDRVYFETGKTMLTTTSLGQLRNVAALLRTYPKARIKLGDYIDSIGIYEVNK